MGISSVFGARTRGLEVLIQIMASSFAPIEENRWKIHWLTVSYVALTRGRCNAETTHRNGARL